MGRGLGLRPRREPRPSTWPRPLASRPEESRYCSIWSPAPAYCSSPRSSAFAGAPPPQPRDPAPEAPPSRVT